jgi:hypothetical protein
MNGKREHNENISAKRQTLCRTRVQQGARGVKHEENMKREEKMSEKIYATGKMKI